MTIEILAQEALELQVALARRLAQPNQGSTSLSYAVDALGSARVDGGLAGLDQIDDLPVDHAAYDLVDDASIREIRPLVHDLLVGLPEALNALEIGEIHEPCAQAVVHVVIVVGDLVGDVRDLRLESRLAAVQESLTQLAELRRVRA